MVNTFRRIVKKMSLFSPYHFFSNQNLLDFFQLLLVRCSCSCWFHCLAFEIFNTAAAKPLVRRSPAARGRCGVGQARMRTHTNSFLIAAQFAACFTHYRELSLFRTLVHHLSTVLASVVALPGAGIWLSYFRRWVNGSYATKSGQCNPHETNCICFSNLKW